MVNGISAYALWPEALACSQLSWGPPFRAKTCEGRECGSDPIQVILVSLMSRRNGA